MKQHINIEQLVTLSEKGKKKLREWWKPQEGDYWTRLPHFPGAMPSVVGRHGVGGNNAYPLLSIGQMIEFILDNDGRFYDVYWNDEVCDDLWEEVEDILNAY